MGPVECDPSSGGPNYPASQSQVAGIQQFLQEQIDGLTPPAGDNLSWKAVGVAAGALFGLVLFAKAVR